MVRERPVETENEVDAHGAFVRQKNRFTTPFGDKEGELPVEAGRYRLIWAKGCNWSNRSSIAIELLGLEDVVSVNLVDGGDHFAKYGWAFDYDEGGKDPVLGVKYLSELYYNTDPNYQGRCTVPALVDIKTKKVVNNDYHHLSNYFEKDFKAFHKNKIDLYPEELRDDIDTFNEWLFHNINNGVYRCFFAQSVEAYEEAYNDFFNGLDVLEERLSQKRFLFGDYVTDSDIRFYVTLARFDAHYYRNLGPIKHRIVDYPNIWAYARDLYEIPAFKHNTYFHYYAEEDKVPNTIFQSFNARFWDTYDFEGLWSTPQNRKALSQTPERKFKEEK